MIFHLKLMLISPHHPVHCCNRGCVCAMSSQGEVGFLAEDRRINVAVTRARRQLTVVCDSQTVRNHDFLKSLADYMTEHGEVRTAFEYLEDAVPQNYTRDPKEASKQPLQTAAQKQSRGESRKGAAGGKKSDMGGKPIGRDAQGKPNGAEKPASGSSRPREETQNRDPDQEKRKREAIVQQIESFLQDPSQTELHFPPSLTSHERLLVHQISEERGLAHQSQGEGKNRNIVVSRHGPGAPPQEQPSTQEPELQRSQLKMETQEVPTTAPEQPRETGAAGVDLKSLHLERMRREQDKRQEKTKTRQQQQQRVEAVVSGAAGKSQQAKKGKGAAKQGVDHHWYSQFGIVFLCL